ncbi:uncharacterized protein [Panulirus ornatus]|uniref:uncharacterized protein n=1 Tax=Panulirus ornatus TaxID=150431 RepID=UPI003A842592
MSVGMGGQRAAWALRAMLMLPLWSSFLCIRSSEGSQAGQPRLITKSAMEVEVLPRPGASTREREIAAVFRGVAYGAIATRAPNATATPPNAPVTDEVLRGVVSSGAPPRAGNDASHNRGPATNRSSHLPNVRYEVSSSTKDTYRVDIVAAPTGSPPAAPGRREHNTSGSSTPADGVGPADVRPDATVGSEDLRVSQGLAWWLQVYVSAGLYTLLAITSLCLMARAAAATRLLPRPHYLSLHVLVFFSTFSRGLYILHDAHTIEHLLPAAVLTAVEEIGWPCLTAALAVMVVGALRAWHPSRRPCAALAIALITVAHLVSLPVTHLALGLLEAGDLPILPTTRVVAVTWGGAVGVAGLWAVWAASRGNSSQLTNVGVNVQETSGSVKPPAHFVLTAAIMQLLLVGVNLYMLVIPVSPPEWEWAWWCRLGLSRGLEMLMAGTLLTAAALTLNQLTHCCALNCYCCHKRTVEIVHPSAIKMIHPLGVYTLQQAIPKNEHAQTIAALSLNNYPKCKRDHKSLDYVTSDFQLVWSHARPLTTSQTAARLDAEDDFLQLAVDKDHDIPRAHILPKTPQNVMKPFLGAEVFTCSLPTYKLYATPESCYQFDEDPKGLHERGFSHTSKGSTVLSGSSGSSKLYSSPQVPLRASRSWDELSTSHIYEEPQRTFCGSVDEALSDLSDMAGVSDLSDMAMDYPNDLLYSDTNSPVLLRPSQRSRRRLPTAHYISAKQFTNQQPNAPHLTADDQATATTTNPQQTTTQESATRQATKGREQEPLPATATAGHSTATQPEGTPLPPPAHRKASKPPPATLHAPTPHPPPPQRTRTHPPPPAQ